MNAAPAIILIVDDLPANRQVMKGQLDRLGHRTIEAEHGQQALQMMREQPIDMVLLDIMMPVMNGFETLGAIKDDPKLSHIPVVVFSALNDVESVARCIALGADDFLFKPVQRLLLEARVNASLGRKRLHDREQAALAAAEEANRAKGRFVALVSHELRSPITALIGYTDLMILQQPPDGDAQQLRYLQALRALGRHMAAVIEDLNDLSRLESGQIRLSPEALPIESMIEGAAGTLRGQFDTRGHQLLFAFEPELPLVWADPVRLIQVLNNLLSNACKYTPDNGRIVVAARVHSPTLVQISVQDNGPGIPAEEQHRVFEPFFRSGEAQVRAQPGTGLGLNITRHLVELQGGTIWFSSIPGQGTTFSFTLLRAAAAATPTQLGLNELSVAEQS